MPSVSSQIATPDAKRRYVRRLFATIADRYDFITIFLSYGRDRAWKRRLVRLAGPLGGRRVLDLATGTGDIAHMAAEEGARAIGLDITPRMVELARTKIDAGAPRAVFLIGDMLALPFPAATVDVVTTGYGLRNVPDLTTAVDEIVRVLKPGGIVLSLDFNRPRSRTIRAVYLVYLTIVGGALGWVLHRDADTYRYIPASIRMYPGAEAVASLMRDRGLRDVTYDRVLGGLMAIHCGRKP